MTCRTGPVFEYNGSRYVNSTITPTVETELFRRKRLSNLPPRVEREQRDRSKECI
jgi:hypothetical protein